MKMRLDPKLFATSLAFLLTASWLNPHALNPRVKTNFSLSSKGPVHATQTARNLAGLDPMDLVNRMEALEQQCFLYEHQTNAMIMQAHLRQFAEMLRPWQSELEQNGIEGSVENAEWISLANSLAWKDLTSEKFAWKEADAWNESFSKMTPVKRCETLALSYAEAISNLATVKAETPLSGPWDILVDEKASTPELMKSIGRDRTRAGWMLRRVHYTNASSVPTECSSLKTEGEKRWKFIFEGNRRALGLAIGMCGRSMNAHYLDDEVTDKVRPLPKGWTF